MWEFEPLSGFVLSAVIEVHRTIGPGLLESIYRKRLQHELSLRGIVSDSEVPIPLSYKSLEPGSQFRVDLLVESAIVVEVKAVEVVLPVHRAQHLSYLRLLKRRVGLLINFNVPVLKDGIVRIVN
jgi:GxxExxY protein